MPTAYTDSATVRLSYTPSGVDIKAKQYTDAATAYLDLQPSGVDLYVPQVFVGTVVGQSRWEWKAAARYQLEATSRWEADYTDQQVIRA